MSAKKTNDITDDASLRCYGIGGGGGGGAAGSGSGGGGGGASPCSIDGLELDENMGGIK